MLWVMIKNNLKLMLRCKWILAIMILGPVIVIAALSSAFHNIMGTKSSVGKFKVGYQIEEESKYIPYMQALQEKAKEQKIEFIRYPEGDSKIDPEDQIKEGSVQVFVEIEGDTYTIYSTEKKEAQAGIAQYMLYQMFHPSQKETEIPTEKKEFVRIPTAINYYGKIEIVYFLWCSMIILATVITSERKNRIQQRLKLSPASNITLYLAKLIPCFLAITIIITIAAILSTVIFDFEWGCPLESILLLLLGAGAVSTVAVVFFNLFTNTAIAVMVEFVVIWIFGFFGGSFETYIYSVLSERIKRLSPIYYLNRVLVELQTKGQSDYTKATVLVYVGIILVGFLLGNFIMKRRMEEQ